MRCPNVGPARYGPPVIDPTSASVFVTDRPEAEDVALISDGLDGFNVQETGIADRRPLAVLVRDQETGRVVGHGWRVFGEIPCDPPGTSRVFMTKDLA
jgi:hypothetical protein